MENKIESSDQERLRRFKDMLQKLGLTNLLIERFISDADDWQDRIVQEYKFGFEHTSERTMGKEVTTEYWFCIFDRVNEILTECSFNCDISEEDAAHMIMTFRSYYESWKTGGELPNDN